MSSFNARPHRAHRSRAAWALSAALVASGVFATAVIATGGPAIAGPNDRATPMPAAGGSLKLPGGELPEGSKTTVASGRITFGEQMGGHADGECSKIKVRAQTSTGSSQVDAVGPSGAHVCTYKIVVPKGALVKLSAHYEDLMTKPNGGWANPVKVQPGAHYDFLMDGKP